MNLNRLIVLSLLLFLVAAGCSTPEKTQQTTTPSASPATSTPPATGKPADSSKPASPSPSGSPTESKPVPAQPAQLGSIAALPGDTAALVQRLGEAGKIRVELVIVAEPVKERTAYLDSLLTQRGSLDSATLLLVLFTREGYDIRFAMGSIFYQKQFTVAEMLTLVRDHYLPKARKGDPAGGLADYLQAVYRRIDR